jgi:hypothetical protein
VWKEYANEALDIIERDIEKSVSMEIKVLDGDWSDELNAYDITDYKYLGITVLGNDIKAGIENANMKVVEHFSESNKKTFATMVEEINQYLNNNLEKEDETMELDNLNDFPVEEVEVTEPTVEDIVEVNEEPIVEFPVVVDEPVVEFNAKDTEIFNLKTDLENKDTEIFNLNATLTTLKQEYDILQTEVIELREYKANNESQKSVVEKQELFAKYSIGLTEDEMKPVFEKFNELSVKEIKTELNEIFTNKNLSEIAKKFNVEKKDIVMDIPKKDNTKSKYAVV